MVASTNLAQQNEQCYYNLDGRSILARMRLTVTFTTILAIAAVSYRFLAEFHP